MMVERQERHAGSTDPLRVLLVDNDRDVSEVVSAILTDEGYEVLVLDGTTHDAIAGAVGRFEPDCILLDGADEAEFGESWTEAAYLSQRARAVPTIMFTAHAGDALEAREGTSDRALLAGFAGILAKPFSLDELVDAVEIAAGRSDRFDRTEAGDNRRTRELVAALSGAGATDIRTSERREWATFVSPLDERIYQIYWWQRLGVYILGRYGDDAHLERVGQFYERSTAIGAALEEPVVERSA